MLKFRPSLASTLLLFLYGSLRALFAGNYTQTTMRKGSISGNGNGGELLRLNVSGKISLLKPYTLRAAAFAVVVVAILPTLVNNIALLLPAKAGSKSKRGGE